MTDCHWFIHYNEEVKESLLSSSHRFLYDVERLIMYDEERESLNDETKKESRNAGRYTWQYLFSLNFHVNSFWFIFSQNKKQEKRPLFPLFIFSLDAWVLLRHHLLQTRRKFARNTHWSSKWKDCIFFTEISLVYLHLMHLWLSWKEEANFVSCVHWCSLGVFSCQFFSSFHN